ncbi:MAG TPA: DEAD/DEAH box helicase [Bacteroidales bacterium]|nr:DEAD/DEAH box helicase [Bacteroidales bacterium]
MNFSEFNLDRDLLEALSYMRFEEATPIQEQAIPLILENRDLIASAQTGTGKTAAFILPVLEKLIQDRGGGTNTLVIVPTRELAIQIEQEVQGFSYFLNIGSIAIYGGGEGKDFTQQKLALKKGTDIVIATPGKLLSHLQLGYVDFSKVEHLILDEADRMLDMGFIDDINKIVKYLPKKRQTLMFSATMPDNIRRFAKQILYKPAEISLEVATPAEGVNQQVFLAHEEQKIKLIDHLLKEREHYKSILIFTSTKNKVSEIVRALKGSGFKSKGISSNLDQQEREEVLRGFKSKRTRILVATDLMSRGIDIKDINLIINYDVPQDAEDYVHRVGRTARAETKGEAITLVTQRDMRRMRSIEELIKTALPKQQPPEHLGAGPQWSNRPKPGKGKQRYHGKKRNYKGNKNRKR